MKPGLQRLALLLAAAGCLVFLARHFFPNEERRVHQCLAALARVVSVPDHPSAAAALLAGDRLRNLLTADVVLDVEAPEVGRQTLTGRPELIRLALAAWEQTKGLQVEFVDVQVNLAPDRASATAGLTAKVTFTGEKDFSVQELKIQLKQEDRQWRVARVETVRALKL